MDDIFKNKTPTKSKHSRMLYSDAYGGSAEKNGKESSYLLKKGQYENIKSYNKCRQKYSNQNEEIRVSRVKKTVQDGTTTKLILDSESNSTHDGFISFDIPSRKLSASFEAGLDLSNLNKYFGITSSIDAITMKIKAVLDEKYRLPQTDSRDDRAVYDSDELRINSAPILFLPNLR